MINVITRGKKNKLSFSVIYIYLYCYVSFLTVQVGKAMLYVVILQDIFTVRYIKLIVCSGIFLFLRSEHIICNAKIFSVMFRYYQKYEDIFCDVMILLIM